jgi:hypothetical protein
MRVRIAPVSGGLVLSGIAPHTRVRAPQISGGEIMAGSSPSFLKRVFGWIANGGITVAGAAQAMFSGGSQATYGHCPPPARMGVKIGL